MDNLFSSQEIEEMEVMEKRRELHLGCCKMVASMSQLQVEYIIPFTVAGSQNEDNVIPCFSLNPKVFLNQ